MIGSFLESLRPRQWTKNLILFAGVIFAQRFGETVCLERAALGFLVFCLASGVVYIFNDVTDIELDRLHPYKRLRPIASGRFPVRTALALSTLLMLGCLAAAWFLGPSFALVTALFFLLNLLYSRLLKKAVIIDVVAIACGFVLRAIASVEVLRRAVSDIQISKWLLLCTFFLSLFLGFSKRRSEIINIQAAGNHTRPALVFYSEPLLNILIGITFTITLTVYAIYTIWPETVAHFGTSNLVLTLPFVFYGMGRYLYLVYKGKQGGRPHEILLNDGAIQLAVGGWIVCVILVIGMQR
jgi:4-hydroxybenzoate polyprenyltransferase